MYKNLAWEKFGKVLLAEFLVMNKLVNGYTYRHCCNSKNYRKHLVCWIMHDLLNLLDFFSVIRFIDNVKAWGGLRKLWHLRIVPVLVSTIPKWKHQKIRNTALIIQPTCSNYMIYLTHWKTMQYHVCMLMLDL